MRKKALLGILFAVIAVIVIILAVRISIKIKQENQKAFKNSFTVSVITAKKTLLKETIFAQSIVEGDPQVKVYPSNNVSGIFLRNNRKEGDYVTKDFDIADIDRNIPGSEYAEAPVKSPISGIITKLYYQDKGAFVAANQPVAEVANINKVKIIVTLGERDLLRVKKDQPVFITSDYSPDLHVNAKVDSVTPYIDNDTFSGYVTIRLNNEDRKLVIGMSVNIEIEIDQRMAFVVPESCILMGQDTTYIYLNRNNKAKMLNVKTGFSRDGKEEIIGDIKEGDQIINDGNFKVYNGAALKIVK